MWLFIGRILILAIAIWCYCGVAPAMPGILIFLLIACFLISLFLLPYALICANPFPTPSGQRQVGTSSLIWHLPDRTGIIAKIWYPRSSKQHSHSPYIDDLDRTLAAMTAGLSPLSKLILNKFYLGRIQIPSEINAALAHSQNGFPVILLSPGFGGVNFLNSLYALEFASHGFIVIGINHPGWCAGTLLVDGSHVAFNKIDFNNADRLDAMLGEIIPQKANNLSAILDELFDRNATPDSWLYQKIDRTKIFAVGHSTGGSASFFACGKDARIAKSVNLDGFLYMDGIDIDRPGKEFLLMLSDRDKYASPATKPQNSFDVLMAKDKIRIDRFVSHANAHKHLLDSVKHTDFLDLPFILNPAFSKRVGLFGVGDGRDLLLKTAATTIDFFNVTN